MNNNIQLITKLHPRLVAVASHAISTLERKGYKPFIEVKAKEDTKAESFELKFRSSVGKTEEKPELVKAIVDSFKNKDWNIVADKSRIKIQTPRAETPVVKAETKSTKKEA